MHRLKFDVHAPVASDGGYPQSHFIVTTKNLIQFIITTYSRKACTRSEHTCRYPEIVTIGFCEQWRASELRSECSAHRTPQLTVILRGRGFSSGLLDACASGCRLCQLKESLKRQFVSKTEPRAKSTHIANVVV